MAHKTIAKAISAVLTIGSLSTAAMADISNQNDANMGGNIQGMEKCYGIAKANSNDCSTANHNCSGEAKADKNPSDWLYVPTGLCHKIAGGSTSSK